MSASRLRTVSQVWPAWLPGALTGVERQLSGSQTSLPRLIFSTSFKALSISSTSSTNPPAPSIPTPSLRRTRPNRLSRPAGSLASNAMASSILRQQSQYGQQIRCYSGSTVGSSSRGNEQDRSSTTTQHSNPAQQTQVGAPQKPTPAWSPPSSIKEKPICIIGAGVIGRRLAVLWASTSRPVTLVDTSPSALKSSRSYIADSLATYCFSHGTHPGHVSFSSNLETAMQDAWMVIECVPEDLELKISLLGRIDRLVAPEVLIATNSAGFTSRELVSEVFHKERVLNTLYYMPSRSKCVELMSCGYTSPSIIPFLVEELQDMQLRPIVIPDSINGKASKGLIFPRVWGAMTKETLKVLSEGVADPEEVDVLFRDFFGAAKGPCEMMDEVGLDTVVKSERSRLPNLREGDGFWGARGEEHVEWLDTEFVKRGKLGGKSGEGLIVRKRRTGWGRKAKGVDVAGQEVWQEHSVDLSGL